MRLICSEFDASVTMKKKRLGANALSKFESSPQRPTPPEAILAKRLNLMVEIARLRNWNGTSRKPLDRAELLLTARWGRATWATRANLLKSAQWLVGLAYSQGTFV